MFYYVYILQSKSSNRSI